METKSTMDYEVTCKLFALTIISFLVAFTIGLGLILDTNYKYIKMRDEADAADKTNEKLSSHYEELKSNYDSSISTNSELQQQIQALQAENIELKK